MDSGMVEGLGVLSLAIGFMVVVWVILWFLVPLKIFEIAKNQKEQTELLKVLVEVVRPPNGPPHVMEEDDSDGSPV